MSMGYIDPTAVIFGDVNIGDSSYVGPYCIVGFPDEIRLPKSSSSVVLNTRPPSGGSKLGPSCELLSNVVIGEGTELEANVWCDHHSYIGVNSKIGAGTQILYGARIYHRVSIGERVWIAGFVCNDAVVEADAVCLGQLVHEFKNASEGIPEAAPIIREGAFVGMNAIIIGGIEVGSRAYVAAGAVLTHSARAGRLYMGTPARDVGSAPTPLVKRKES
jgi:UDP-2-acetamido-3-amino-2,3-dideoxy-glucuronate N-acetyltransferase